MKVAKVKSRTVMGVVSLLILFDFLTKFLFRILGVGYMNTGVSFSAFAEVSQIVLILAGLAICCFLIALMAGGSLSKTSFGGTALMLAGGLGNLASRVVWGGVWDWIGIGFLPVFNVADILINAGCFLFVIGFLYDLWR